MSEQEQMDPSRIMQVGMAFWPAKTLLTAVHLGLFTYIAEGERSAQDIRAFCGLHDRGLYDFLDALVALGFLKRSGLKETAMYSNAPDVDLFLDKQKPSYVGGILEMANNRLYPFWNDLEEALKTGLPQNETKNGGRPIFEALYADEGKLKEFLAAMGGVQMGNFIAFAQMFDFSPYKSLCDIGGAGAYLAAQVALQHDHMECISFDLPAVAPIATENVQAMGIADRVRIESGDFFQVAFPHADIICMGNILHDWGTTDKQMLIEKAYQALPAGGALVVIENIIDNDRSENAFGLMMSLNMLIETSAGYDFTRADFDEMVTQAGFSETRFMALAGPTTAAIAIK